MKPIIGVSIVTIDDPNHPEKKMSGTLVASMNLTGYGTQTIRLSDGSLYRSEGYLKILT